MAAVQSQYQIFLNKERVKDMLPGFLERYKAIEIEGEKLVEPDTQLLRSVLEGVEERYVELTTLINGHFINSHFAGGSDNQIASTDTLLKATLYCGAYEILAHHEIDAPIIINDYIHVTQAFYDNNESKLVNGVLDAMSKTLR